MEAGTWMLIKDGHIRTEKYWDPTAHNYDFDLTDKSQVRQKIKELMLQSVKRRLVSDVPVGAFLSGGIDSSAVVGLMTEAGDAHPNTFTVSFEEKEYDESLYANMVAKKFKTNHTQVNLRPEIMLDELTNALDMMDTPSGDGINTYVVSKAIRKQGIRVALSGVGGDELFAGYPIFDQYIRLQQRNWIWKIPEGWRNIFSGFTGWKGKPGRILQILQSQTPAIENVYPVFRQLISPHYLQRLTNLNDADGSTLAFQLKAKKDNLQKLPFFSQVTAAEYLGYTQQTLLKDTDQMSMANSLEIRSPF
jgi:asparagine synthase (glutamine-hydrolysing)